MSLMLAAPLRSDQMFTACVTILLQNYISQVLLPNAFIVDSKQARKEKVIDGSIAVSFVFRYIGIIKDF